MRLAVEDARVVDLLRMIGTLYSWGAGGPADGLKVDWYAGVVTPKSGGRPGLCCSGAAQVMLVQLGCLSPTAPDRTSGALYDACTKITEDEVQLGDLVFFAQPVSHVMVCLGYGMCMGASGGDRNTHADNPAAYVRLQRVHYRTDNVRFGTFR